MSGQGWRRPERNDSGRGSSNRKNYNFVKDCKCAVCVHRRYCDKCRNQTSNQRNVFYGSSEDSADEDDNGPSTSWRSRVTILGNRSERQQPNRCIKKITIHCSKSGNCKRTVTKTCSYTCLRRTTPTSRRSPYRAPPYKTSYTRISPAPTYILAPRPPPPRFPQRRVPTQTNVPPPKLDTVQRRPDQNLQARPRTPQPKTGPSVTPRIDGKKCSDMILLPHSPLYGKPCAEVKEIVRKGMLKDPAGTIPISGVSRSPTKADNLSRPFVDETYPQNVPIAKPRSPEVPQRTEVPKPGISQQPKPAAKPPITEPRRDFTKETPPAKVSRVETVRPPKPAAAATPPSGVQTPKLEIPKTEAVDLTSKKKTEVPVTSAYQPSKPTEPKPEAPEIYSKKKIPEEVPIKSTPEKVAKPEKAPKADFAASTKDPGTKEKTPDKVSVAPPPIAKSTPSRAEPSESKPKPVPSESKPKPAPSESKPKPEPSESKPKEKVPAEIPAEKPPKPEKSPPSKPKEEPTPKKVPEEKSVLPPPSQSKPETKPTASSPPASTQAAVKPPKPEPAPKAPPKEEAPPPKKKEPEKVASAPTPVKSPAQSPEKEKISPPKSKASEAPAVPVDSPKPKVITPEFPKEDVSKKKGPSPPSKDAALPDNSPKLKVVTPEVPKKDRVPDVKPVTKPQPSTPTPTKPEKRPKEVPRFTEGPIEGGRIRTISNVARGPAIDEKRAKPGTSSTMDVPLGGQRIRTISNVAQASAVDKTRAQPGTSSTMDAPLGGQRIRTISNVAQASAVDKTRTKPGTSSTMDAPMTGPKIRTISKVAPGTLVDEKRAKPGTSPVMDTPLGGERIRTISKTAAETEAGKSSIKKLSEEEQIGIGTSLKPRFNSPDAKK